MKKISKIMIIALLLVILLIGNSSVIAVNEYSNSIKLASVNTDQMSFGVRFSGEPEVSNRDKVKAAITNDLNATISVSGLNSKENIETATYVVQNTSTDLLANLSIQVTNSNKEYFSVTAKIEKSLLSKGEATTVTVEIELIKEPPYQEKVTSTIGIQLEAVAEQPGTGGDSGNTGTSSGGTSSKPSSGKPNEKDDTPNTGDSKFINMFWR